MHQGSPNLFLFEFRPVLGMRLDHFEQVSARSEFHDDTQCGRSIIVEGLLVANDIVAIVGGQDPDLVECVISFLLLHGSDLDLE